MLAPRIWRSTFTKAFSSVGEDLRISSTRTLVQAEPLALAEQVFAASPEVRDVQRFGDRLDVMTPDPDAAERDLRERAAANNMPLREEQR
jgi:hypothetical protein